MDEDILAEELRKLREGDNHDNTFYESDDEGSDQESESAISGNSWLSNATIISQLPDSRIKESIRYLKTQIKIMEAELLSRTIEGRRITNKGITKIGRLRPLKDGERSSVRRRSPERNCKEFTKIAATLRKLGVKNIEALLQEWNKITKEPKT